MFIRNCPNCKIQLTYSSKGNLHEAIKKKSVCRSCGQIGRKHSEETKQKMSKSGKGRIFSEKHRLRISAGQRGKILSNKTKQKISEVMKGRVFSDATKRKMSKNNVGFKGRKHSKETKQKLRLSHINRLEQIHGQLFPGYNPVACGIIEEYGKKHGFNFQHAENGGEFHIKELGFWVDGYDAKKNVVIEYYENWHQTQLTKDNNRKLEIVDCLDCEFIELKAWDTTGN